MMNVMSVDRARNTARVEQYSEHLAVCSMDGRVRTGQACLCPQRTTLMAVPLDKVEAQLRDPLPDGDQDPWVTVKDV